MNRSLSPTPVLSTAQRAAVAKLSYALETGGAVAVLCGPAGVGKSLVLEALVRCPTLRGRAVEVVSPAALADRLATDAALPDAVLIDEAHLVADGELSRLVATCRSRLPRVGIVLAGEGRLLTLVARDAGLERLVRLRVTVPPFSRDETRLLVAAHIGAALPPGDDTGVAGTIHEIAGGIPGRIVPLADLARTVAEGKPGRHLSVDDIEAIHRRLAINAA
jgi:type II secretory pathway predicted ATPase ExeA